MIQGHVLKEAMKIKMIVIWMMPSQIQRTLQIEQTLFKIVV